MKLPPVRSLARSGRLALIVAVAAIVEVGHVQAQSWRELPQPANRPAALAPTFFASAELTKAMADWGPLPYFETLPGCYACDQPAACACGACSDCCQCGRGRQGRLGRWLASWDGTLELGLNGADGNANHFNLFLGLDGRFAWDEGSYRFDLDYFYHKARSAITANRLVALSRYERGIGSSPIGWYAESLYEFDQLRNYDGRVAMAGGLTFPLADRDHVLLRSRLGFGTSKKIAAIDDRWRPELQTGLEGELRLTGRQRLFGHVDYYPDVSRFRTYRLNGKLGWEALLEARWGLALRASISNWHDSNPGPGTVANDLYYVLALAWSY